MFAPKWKKEALHLAKNARKFVHYKRDLLDATRIDEIESRRQDLLDSIKTRDPERVKEASRQLEHSCQQSLPREKPLTWLEDNVEVMFVAIVIALGLRTYYLQPFRIPTGSMQPTLNGIIGTPLAKKDWPSLPARMAEFATRGRSYASVVNDRDRTIAPAPKTPIGLAMADTNFLHFFSRGVIRFTDGSTLRLPGPINPCMEAGLQNTLAALPRSAEGIFVPKGTVLLEGTLDSGDLVLVDKMSYHFRHPRRGEVFVFKTLGIRGIMEYSGPQGGGTHYIKRLCGLPGDNLAISPPNLTIDGKIAMEPGIQRVAQAQPPYHLNQGYSFGEVMKGAKYITGPKDFLQLRKDAPQGLRQYAALGDNTGNSLDSRYWGTVPEYNLVGPALFSLWPITTGHWGLIK